jgi:hypothetical protein
MRKVKWTLIEFASYLCHDDDVISGFLLVKNIVKNKNTCVVKVWQKYSDMNENRKSDSSEEPNQRKQKRHLPPLHRLIRHFSRDLPQSDGESSDEGVEELSAPASVQRPTWRPCSRSVPTAPATPFERPGGTRMEKSFEESEEALPATNAEISEQWAQFDYNGNGLVSVGEVHLFVQKRCAQRVWWQWA